MAVPLLGLASLLGREYAYTRPTYAEQDAIMKVVSPQTYYGNQLINYLTDKFDIDSDLSRAQARVEGASREYYGNGPKGISPEEYDRQMAELSAQVNAPGSVDRFENYLRDADYGTIDQNAKSFRGPQAEGSYASQYAADSFPVTVGQLPVESNFTPEQLADLEQYLLGKSADMGPQPDAPDTPRKPDFTPQGAGGEFMPSGYEKNPFNTSYEEIEQYLSGGVVGRRRA
jgi:hypothetical protein